MKPVLQPRRYVCPRNGEPARCLVCQTDRPHKYEEWSREAGECPTHHVRLVEQA